MHPQRKPPGAAMHARHPCRFFGTSTGCRYGTNCRFLHGDPEVAARNDHQAQESASDPPVLAHSSTAHSKQNNELIAWKRRLSGGGRRGHPLDPARLGQLFQVGLQLVSSEPGTRYEVLQSLATEGGLAAIHELIESGTCSGYSSGPSLMSLTYFYDRFVPLFNIMTQPDVLSSFVLEKYRDEICGFMYGSGGRRLTKLLTTVVESMRKATDQAQDGGSTDTKDESKTLTKFESALAVVAQIVELNGGAQINPDIPPLVQRLAVAVEAALTTQGLPHGCQAVEHLSNVQERLGIGQTIATFRPEKKASSLRPVFYVDQDLPGLLSPKGPRHDNDFVEISEIQILPTVQEIRSERSEYLPHLEAGRWHHEGIKGLLDRHFRLLREDTIGQLRDAIRTHIDEVESSSRGHAKARSQEQQLRTHVYEGINVHKTFLHYFHGLCVEISFRQPYHVRHMSSDEERQEWWQRSRRLQADALVCLTDNRDLLLFCTVCEPDRAKPASSSKGREANVQEDSTARLRNKADRAFATIKFCSSDHRDVTNALDVHQNNSKITLVEFPGLLLPAFEHTLKALQKMSQTMAMPFADLILQNRTDENAVRRIPPPEYSTKPGFEFPLQCILNDGTDLHYKPGSKFDANSLCEHSSLDSAQSQAVIAALSRSLAMIQGPPGTGKSYVGVAIIRILANCRTAGDLGPILCVCYTNHALDQLLEHLVEHGVKQIVRIGSRSKSKLLAPLNLDTVAKMTDGGVKAEVSAQYKHLRELEEEINELLEARTRSEHWKLVRDYLDIHHPEHHAALFATHDTDGFRRVIKESKVFRTWLSEGQPDVPGAPPVDATDLYEQPLDKLSRNGRRALYNHWQQASHEFFQGQLKANVTEYLSHRARFDRTRQEARLRCLRSAGVIGVTTSGLARNLELLTRVRCKVIMCEEAGEVLEAQMLTALLPSVQHAILIGDHLQLRPQIQRHELSAENPHGSQFSLDLSLFERLAQPLQEAEAPLPFSTLQVQRRMHPSISRLIRHTLYPALQDSDSVSAYPPVVGMKHRLFWFDHRERERAADQDDAANTSHTNEYEIGMTVALASHLLRQGEYKPNDIAVLTPYLAQLHRLRQELGKMYEVALTDQDQDALAQAELIVDGTATHTKAGVHAITKLTMLQALKVATVDNFQGEEAKIVVVSLVRSNPQNRCGFLRTSNRINVLLSRAQHGMYIIGNTQTARSAQMWSDVISMLSNDGLVGSDLELQCPRHVNTPLKVRQPDDFQRLSPEAGCQQKCVERLRCGHACINRCHSQMLHNAVVCLVPCPRPRRGCTHPCPLKCGNPCLKNCTVNVFDPFRILPCGHGIADLPCWQSQDLSKYPCQDLVKRKIPGCQHEIALPCSEEYETDEFQCSAPCNANLQCGHTCQRPCWECKTRSQGVIVMEDHQKCEQQCGRPYTTCNHFCSEPCHGKQRCPLCESPCEVSCNHSRCSKKCHEPCAPCAEQHCASQCPHSRCHMPCAAPCDWIPCNRRCSEILDCGHQCPSLCGETCPTSEYCQRCCSEAIKDQIANFVGMESYAEIDLDDDPCIFPSCGHIVSVSSMDRHIDMAKHYNLDENGSVVSVKDSHPFSVEDKGMKACPNCRGSLRNIARYGRIVRRALLDESTKKFIVWSSQSFDRLSNTLHALQTRLADTFEIVELEAVSTVGLELSITQDEEALQQTISDLSLSERYKNILGLRWYVQHFLRQVAEEEQPYHRVWELCIDARRRRQAKADFEVDDSVLQTKCRLDAAALAIRCDLTIVSDLVSVIQNKLRIARLKSLDVDLALVRSQSAQLRSDAQSYQRVAHEVESYMFSARCSALESTAARTARGDKFVTEAQGDLHVARQLCEAHPRSTRGMLQEIEAIERTLRTTFYTVVTSDERMEVLRAMANEFRGTGHWYYCRNGHPFTIGECGGPMEQTRCPECDAQVGGWRHRAADGVIRASDLEDELQSMSVRA